MKYREGRVDIWYGQSTPLDKNALLMTSEVDGTSIMSFNENSGEWDISNNVGISSIVDSMSDDIADRYSNVYNKPLDNLKQVLYRNLECDNQLPTADFSGRTREIQTAISLISNTGELGTEAIVDAADRNFTEDTGNWTLTEECTISGGNLNLVSSDGELESATFSEILNTGDVYLIRIEAVVTDGAIDLSDSFSGTSPIVKNGISIFRGVAISDDLIIKRNGTTDAKISSISVSTIGDDVSGNLLISGNDRSFTSSGYWSVTSQCSIAGGLACLVSSNGSEQSVYKEELLEIGKWYYIFIGVETVTSGAIGFSNSFDTTETITKSGYQGFKFQATSTTLEFSTIGVTNITFDYITMVKIDIDTESTYVLSNMPYIHDLVENTDNWLYYQVKTDGLVTPEENAIKITSVEYIDNIGEFTNCCKITLNDFPMYSRVGENCFIMTYKAFGINLSSIPAFPGNNRTSAPTSWNRSLSSILGPWKHTNGMWRCIVVGENSSASPAYTKAKYHLFECDGDVMTGTWNDLTGGNSCIVAGHIPSPYYGIRYTTGSIRMPGRDNVFGSVVSLLNASNVISKFAWMEWDTNADKFTFTPITIDVDGFTMPDPQCASGVFYKGEYIITIQDGTILTGKRIAISSKYKEGPYTLHSELWDLTDVPGLEDYGSMMSEYVVHGIPYVYNGDLYLISDGSSTTFMDGNAYKHQIFLWKYNDAKNSWSKLSSPIIMAQHGFKSNYDDAPLKWWGTDHMSLLIPSFVENGRLYFSYSSSMGWGYSTAFGYIDLALALN